MIGLQVPDLSSMLRNGLQTPLNVRGENSGPASGSSHIGALQEAVLVEEHCVPSGTALCQCKCPRQLLRGSLVPPPPPTSWVHHRRLHLCTQSETVVVAASVASWSSLGFPGGGPTIAADLRSGHCPHNCRTILEVEDGLNKKEDPKEEQKKKKSRTE